VFDPPGKFLGGHLTPAPTVRAPLMAGVCSWLPALDGAAPAYSHRAQVRAFRLPLRRHVQLPADIRRPPKHWTTAHRTTTGVITAATHVRRAVSRSD